MRALQEPGHGIYTFLSGDQEEIARLTFSGLDHRARAIAALLQIKGVEGEPVLLLFPPGLDFISAFFGCLYAGAVAAPAYPPHSSWSLPRLRAIIMNARPRVILTLRSLRSRMQRWIEQLPELERLQWLDVDGITLDAAEQWRDPMVAGGDLALLQYTSGSTATPKGVMLSHGNLIHNQKLIKGAFRQTRESIVVGWLPLYHDMGLIGNVLQPLFTGSR